MLKSYLKIAVRNLLKHKGYSLINICGLAIGIACCLLIALWLMHELSYDRFHAHAERIYRAACGSGGAAYLAWNTIWRRTSASRTTQGSHKTSSETYQWG